MIDRYSREEFAQALAASIEGLKKAGIEFKGHRVDGEAARGIIDTAKKLGCDNIEMDTRGCAAVANPVLGWIATNVLHLATAPVTLVH